MTTKEKADALVEKHYKKIMSFLNERQKMINAVKCAILSVEHTIEVLNKILAHDKERYGITSRGATIELDEQTELLTELKNRL